MDRASDSGSEGWGFESLPVYQIKERIPRRVSSLLFCATRGKGRERLVRNSPVDCCSRRLDGAKHYNLPTANCNESLPVYVALWAEMQTSPVAVPDKIFGLTLFLDFIDRCHSLSSLHPPPAALASLPLPVYRQAALGKRTRTSFVVDPNKDA